jgi:mono/diheme cytochrome c family protein
MKVSQKIGTDSAMARVWSRRGLLLLAIAAVGVVLAGCSRGSYPLDFFSEMHYNQSYKIQEPPSLSAPSDSVPLTGREVEYSVADAPGLVNPVAVSAAMLQQGQVLYQINCAVCHGATGLGDGPMREKLTTAGYRGTPANLTTSGSVSAGEGGMAFLVITKGFAGAFGMPPDQFVMPPFGKLITAEDRWTLVHYLRSIQ